MATEMLVICYNKGCGQRFDPNNNNEDDCQYHPGGPVFHDAMKGWSCCKKRSTDFSEFLSVPGCARGKHSNIKPPEPEKPSKSESKEVIICKAPKPFKPDCQIKRPSSNEPKQKLRYTVVASLKTALEKKLEQLSLERQEADTSGTSTEIKLGTSCKNNSCKACYNGEESNTETCTFHPGIPIFHEGMKFWSCCQRKTSDFDNFLDQEGCETGTHLWVKLQSAEQKVACRFDWHQTPSTVTISIFAKVAVPEKCCIEANQVICDILIPFEGGKSLYERKIELRETIDPARSNVKMMGTKVEINLKKTESCSWASLELPPANKPVADSDNGDH